MPIASLTGAVHSRLAEWVALVHDAWRRLRPWHFRTAMALGVAVMLWELLIHGPFLPFWFIGLFSESGRRNHLDYLMGFGVLPELIRYEFVAFAILLAVAVADRAVDLGRMGRGSYGVAVVIAVGLASPFAYAVLPFGTTWLSSSLYAAMSWLLFGSLATFVYVHRKHERATRERLAAAELERTKRAKRALESRLAAMQARVEPQFLFNTLAQVSELYDTDAARAERMLEELIAYLRAAMPKMRDTSSTLAQELELVRAYLAIVKVRLGDRLTYEIESPSEAADARMPPMMLLPLTDHAIVHGLERSDAKGTIRVFAGTAEGRLRLTVVDSGVGFVLETRGDGIASIRDRLFALYGDGARLAFRKQVAGPTEAVLEIPYEPIDTLTATVG